MTGSSLTLNAWLANLTTARNAASDNALVALAKTKGMEVSHTAPQHGNKWAKVRGGKKMVAALADCPETVMVPVMVRDDEGDLVMHDFRCMFSAVDGAAPRVQATTEIIGAVVRSIAQGSVGVSATVVASGLALIG